VLMICRAIYCANVLHGIHMYCASVLQGTSVLQGIHTCCVFIDSCFLKVADSCFLYRAERFTRLEHPADNPELYCLHCTAMSTTQALCAIYWEAWYEFCRVPMMSRCPRWRQHVCSCMLRNLVGGGGGGDR
jgi:hypothetical protein